jgi:hypothetical protein
MCEEARSVSKRRAPPSTQSAPTLTENAQSFRLRTSHDYSGDDDGNYDDGNYDDGNYDDGNYDDGNYDNCDVEWSGEEAHHGGTFQIRDITLDSTLRGRLHMGEIISWYTRISTNISYLLCAVGFFASLIVRLGGCALLKMGSKIEPTGRSVTKRAGKLRRLCNCLLGLSVLVSLVASKEVSRGISVAEEGRKLAITLSGSNTGQCAVDGICFSSLNYATDERCTFTMGNGGVLNVISFDTESRYDELTVGGSQYSGTTGPQSVSVSAGEEITWSSDYSTTEAGFEICVGDPCVASSTPSDDGSDGNFYCINGGVVGGWWDEDGSSCTCTSCNTGLGGPNCAICATGYSGSPPDDCTPDPCQATSDSTDDGSDGNFYCINGGDIGGTTGSCTCSSCNTGFYGLSCQNPHHVSDMNGLFNTISNFATTNTGNSIMLNGDTAILAVRLYKCSGGTCASSYYMLYTYNLNGEVKCVEDNASCVLDGENERRVMYVVGTGSGTLILRALTFDKGSTSNSGGGVNIQDGAIVDLELCIFSNNRATSSDYGGGAIFLQNSGTTVNVYGTSFNGNTADSGKGDDIYRNSWTTITIHNMCPSPYSSNTPIQGMDKNEYCVVCRTIPNPTTHFFTTAPLPIPTSLLSQGPLWTLLAL